MGSKMRRRRRISWVGLWVDGGVKALVQAVTWTCPDGMVSFPMTGTAYSRYLSSVQCSLQCILVHNLGACTSLCVLVQLGSGAVVLVPFSPYCVWLKPLQQTLRTFRELWCGYQEQEYLVYKWEIWKNRSGIGRIMQEDTACQKSKCLRLIPRYAQNSTMNREELLGWNKYVSEENLGVCEGVSIDPSMAGCAGVK